MSKSNVIGIGNQATDVLTVFLKESAQKMLQIAIEQEVKDFIESYKQLRLEDGKQRVTRNDYLPEHSIHTGKELVGLVYGFRESKESWLELLRELKEQGLATSQKLSIGMEP